MSDLRDTTLVQIESKGTRLITRADDPQTLTTNREECLRDAVTRALAEYLTTLRIDFRGKQYRFEQVFQTWSEPEELAVFPSAAVYCPDPGDYDASRLSQRILRFDDDAVLTALKESCELSQSVVVEAWATSPVERAALTSMLEDAFEPVDWMYGFILEMPHYFGGRVGFEKMTVDFEDDPEVARRRWRKTVITLNANTVQYVPISRPPTGRPRVKGEVDGIDDDVATV